MKICVLLFVIVTVVLAQDPNCSHQSDCPDGECCVHSGLFGGLSELGRKRFIFGDGNSLFNHIGHCKPLKKVNETCLPFMTHDIFNHELYESHCPCEKTLECRGEKVNEGPHNIQHINPKCQTMESN